MSTSRERCRAGSFHMLFGCCVPQQFSLSFKTLIVNLRLSRNWSQPVTSTEKAAGAGGCWGRDMGWGSCSSFRQFSASTAVSASALAFHSIRTQGGFCLVPLSIFKSFLFCHWTIVVWFGNCCKGRLRAWLGPWNANFKIGNAPGDPGTSRTKNRNKHPRASRKEWYRNCLGLIDTK